jgi:uncharacterized protein (TIGR03435 family)
MDPGRFVWTHVSTYKVIAWAYGKDCGMADRAELITGGPSWIRTEPFAIEAVIPAGGPGYTRLQMIHGNAPKVQKMLQALLVDRFKLAIRTETKELPVYNLVVAKNTDRLKLSDDQTPVEPIAGTGSARGTLYINGGQNTGGVITVRATAVPLQFILDLYLPLVDRPVLSKLDFNTLYDIAEFQFTPETGGRNNQVNQFFEQLGLRLDPAKGPMEVIVIEKIEKPSEN